MEKINQLEEEISEIRYNLMIKGMVLNSLKQNINAERLNEIEALNKEVNELRKNLSTLNQEISKLKYKYFVSYEVTFLNNWTQESQKEIYHEVIFLNNDANIDFPTVTKSLLDKDIESLLLELISFLKNKYDEVTLLVIKKI